MGFLDDKKYFRSRQIRIEYFVTRPIARPFGGPGVIEMMNKKKMMIVPVAMYSPWLVSSDSFWFHPCGLLTPDTTRRYESIILLGQDHSTRCAHRGLNKNSERPTKEIPNAQQRKTKVQSVSTLHHSPPPPTIPSPGKSLEPRHPVVPGWLVDPQNVQ